MVTVVPGEPEVGVKKLMDGAAQNAEGTAARNKETSSDLPVFLNGFILPFNLPGIIVPTRRKLVSQTCSSVNHKPVVNQAATY
jgi:hypothetical protein